MMPARQEERSRQKVKMGELLIKAKMISQEQLDVALDIQKDSNKKIGRILIEMGAITETQLCETLGFQVGIPFADIAIMALDLDIVNLIPERIAVKHNIIAVELSPENNIIVAVADPLDVVALDEIKAVTGFNPKVMISTQSAIEKAINEYYKLDQLISNKLKDIAPNEMIEFIGESGVGDEIFGETADKTKSAPIIRMLNYILTDAIIKNASDVHFEPQVMSMQIRLRVDGILKDHINVPKSMQEALVSRVKIISALDIAEKRLPQDGRSRVKLHSRGIDLRISTLPTIYGEKVVIRILDKSKLPINLKNLGLDEDIYKIIDSFLQNTKGMIFASGPTGSGKTTTLYAALGHIKTRAKNIVTIEDPVEYAVDGVSQVQVNEKAGVTFASGLRSILRQDPDIILVGEVRDHETAQISFESSLTGHLVLSSVHTNSAAGAIIRLLELGIKPYLITESVIGIIAQRLVRRLCDNCKTLRQPNKELLDMLGIGDNEIFGKKIYKAVGCEKCGDSGYKGRIAIFEILKMDQEIKNQITDKISEKTLIDIGKMAGMRTLREEGIDKIFEGITTLEEVMRVTYEEKETVFSCPRCGKALAQSFSICPYCQQDLVPKKCNVCGKKLLPLWQLCPYCQTVNK